MTKDFTTFLGKIENEHEISRIGIPLRDICQVYITNPTI